MRGWKDCPKCGGSGWILDTPSEGHNARLREALEAEVAHHEARASECDALADQGCEVVAKYHRSRADLLRQALAGGEEEGGA